MSEPLRLAKTAREHLASALRALQSDDNVPEELMEVADPIAEAMSSLHRIERSGGATLEGREAALQKVRAALDLLIALKVSHPAVDLVTDSVALSIGKAAALVRFKAPAAVEAPVPQPLLAPPAPSLTPQPVTAAPAPSPQPVAVAPAPKLVAEAPVPQPVVAAPAPAPQPVVIATSPVAHSLPARVEVPMEQLSVADATLPAPPLARAPAIYPGGMPDAGGRPFAPIKPAAGAPTIDVEMGAHSASNFYKGLSGNDVIEHGGIFVATYRTQKIGQRIHLRVLLPGNYEFLANGVVQWTRAAGASDDSAAPGFGARITEINPDGRHLVYRYTRNREPIFYDDL